MIATVKNEVHHRSILKNIAHQAMLERNLLPEFSRDVLIELDNLARSSNQKENPGGSANKRRDLRNLLWSSIDNDDSYDLDQLTVA